MAACCAYPVLSHLSAVTGEPGLAAVALALVAWGLFAARMRPLLAALLGALVLALGLALTVLFPAAVLYVPPLAIYLGLCATFAASMRRGREPMVSLFARLERGGELPPELVRYTRILTGLWVLFFAAMASVSLGLALWGTVDAWSIFTNFVSYVLLALFFVAEYLFRRWRYPNHQHAGLVEFLRRIPSYRIGARQPGGRGADGR